MSPMLRPAPAAPSPTQSPSQIAAAVEDFLAEHPNASLLEDGLTLFDLRTARYTLSTEHNRCTLHLWDDNDQAGASRDQGGGSRDHPAASHNMVRRILAATPRRTTLRLVTQRFGQVKPQVLELTPDCDRRAPTARDSTRARYLRILERVLTGEFPDWKPDAFRAAMDLEKSFGPAYARGLLLQGQHAWAVIGINDDELPATIDGILTIGLLWLAHCREHAGGRRLVQGLRLIVPRGAGALTLSRIPWLNPTAARCELYELDQPTETLAQLDPADSGNLSTHLGHAPNLETARERFAESAARVMALVPQGQQEQVEQRIRSGRELAFLLNGLEFARIRIAPAANSFDLTPHITFGAGASETPLTPETEPALRDLLERLFLRRSASGSQSDPLYRMQPERWLESALRRDVAPLDAHDTHLQPDLVYSQVPAFAAADRAMLDLLTVTHDGRLAVIELKAEEDLHFALQGLDYWIRVRHHHLQNPDPVTGLGEFQAHGYFGGLVLSRLPPRLFLAAPALRIHPATETILRLLSPAVDWTLIALDERWRHKVRSVWRKRHTDAPADLI